jgi:hypothetical protein
VNGNLGVNRLAAQARQLGAPHGRVLCRREGSFGIFLRYIGRVANKRTTHSYLARISFLIYPQQADPMDMAGPVIRGPVIRTKEPRQRLWTIDYRSRHESWYSNLVGDFVWREEHA